MELLVIGLFIVLGTVFLVVEIAMIPGVGIMGFIGAAAMIASAVYAFMNMGILAGWITMAIVVLVTVMLVLWAIYGKSLDNVALKKEIDSTVEKEGSEVLKVGEKGVSVTRLALIGEAQFGERIVEVTSCDGFIGEKNEIVVKRIVSGIVYVAKL